MFENVPWTPKDGCDLRILAWNSTDRLPPALYYIVG